MIVQIFGCVVMSGFLIYAEANKHGTTDALKIQRVAKNCGLTVKEGKDSMSIQLLRRRKRDWGTEYVFRIPLGLSFDDFQAKKTHFEDGLNHKRGLFEITLNDLRSLKLRRDFLVQIRKLINGPKHRKEIVMEYDGTLKMSIFREPMPELVEYEKVIDTCSGWRVCVGVGRCEEKIYHDFEAIPHIVVAGMTTYGKSVFLKVAITTLIEKQPKNVNFTLIDLKGGLSFNRFKNTKQVDCVAKDVDEALNVLRSIKQRLKERENEFLNKGFENIREAGFKRRDFIIVDEAAELSSTGEKDPDSRKKKIECEQILAEIARVGGSLGFRLIYSTQYPTADVLPRQIKQNCDARLCFRLATEVASHVVLDEGGADKLPQIKGRAIYRTDRKIVLQSPYIQNETIDNVIKPHITIKARTEADDVGTKGSPARSNSVIIEET